jgi:hypothetical protein
VEKFVTDLTSSYWWVSVVVMGIAINLVSSFLKTPIDRFVEKRSKTQREKRQLRNSEIRIKAKLILTDQRMLILTCFERTRLQQVHVSLFIAMCLCYALGFYGSTNFGSNFLSGGIVTFSSFALGFWCFIRMQGTQNRIDDISDAIYQAREEISLPILKGWSDQLVLEKTETEKAEVLNHQLLNPKP